MTDADGGLDMDTFADHQMESLQQLMSVTEMEVEVALPLLQRSQWNVQVGSIIFMRICVYYKVRS